MLTPMEKDQFWHMIDGLTAYDHAVEMMQSHHRRLVAGEAGEAVFLLSHPPVYTAGTSARREDLLKAHLPKDIQIIADTGRGGQWTYHGPGQRIIWPVLDLNRRKRDIRAYIHTLEGWVMQVLDRQFGITSQRREGLPGLWVSRSDIGRPEQMDKIAAIGVRISKWVTMHGIAVNIDPDLSHYRGIVACGVTDGGITSMAELGHLVSEAEFDMALQAEFPSFFGKNSALARD